MNRTLLESHCPPAAPSHRIMEPGAATLAKARSHAGRQVQAEVKNCAVHTTHYRLFVESLMCIFLKGRPYGEEMRLEVWCLKNLYHKQIE